jgi:sodium-dependent dicarboxylate transporter 2/3/5
MADAVMDKTEKSKIDLKRWFFTGLGILLFIVVFYSPPWPDAIDPVGKHFSLSPEGKGAIAVFLLAGIWWVFEVIPIGITSLAIGVLQALFFIRPAKEAFNDFMDPAVLFIFSCLMIGLVFTKTGLQSAGLQDVVLGRKDHQDLFGNFHPDHHTHAFHGAHRCGCHHFPPPPICQ